MKKVTNTSLNVLKESLSHNQSEIIAWLEKWIKRNRPTVLLQRNRLVYKFPNKTLIYCTMENDAILLWFGQWAKLIKKYPILSWAFDEHMKVVSKLRLHSIEDIQRKWVVELITLQSQIWKNFIGTIVLANVNYKDLCILNLATDWQKSRHKELHFNIHDIQVSQQQLMNHIDIESFLLSLRKFFGDKDMQQIQEALDRAIQAHDGQVRKYEWIPYITHPMAVAVDVASKYQDKELVLAALLHDIVEDCDVRFQEVYENYGEAVGYMVEAVSKSPLFFIHQPEVVYGDKIEKLLAWWMNDVRVLLLKIADRDHNLKSLEWLKPNKQIRMTFETQAIYEPLKNLMKCNNIRGCSSNLKQVLLEVKIKTPKDFKVYLFSKTFENFDNDTFSLAYDNTNKIAWQIDNLSLFKSLISQSAFENNINIIDLQTDWENFRATFFLVNWFNVKFDKEVKLSTYNYISL